MDSRSLNSATSSAVLITSLLDAYAKDDPQRILAGTINTERRKLTRSNARIGLYDQAVIFGNLTNILGNNWVGRHKFSARYYAMDPVAKAARNAHSIGEAMDVLVRFAPLWSPALCLETFTEDDVTLLSVDVISAADPGQDAGLQTLKNFCLALVLDIFGKSLGRAGKKIKILQEKSVPMGVQPFTVLKDQNRSGLAVPVSICAKPMSGSQSADYNKALSEILTLTETKDRSFRNKVSDQIKTITNHRPTLSEISRALGLSPRTLNRRLETTGTSFREILEQITKERAENLLANTDLSRADIAEKLGYKDQASFSRALKRWKQSGHE